MKFSMERLIRKFEPRYPSDKRYQDYSRSSSELVSILFAVVLGIGLSELKGITIRSYDFGVLLLAYIAVMMSWWGYHWGIVFGPKEVNRLNHFIDCALVLVYGVLIYIRAPILLVIGTYTVMFLLYWFWEWVRTTNSMATINEIARVKGAARINLFFAVCMTVLFVGACFLKYSLLAGEHWIGRMLFQEHFRECNSQSLFHL